MAAGRACRRVVVDDVDVEELVAICVYYGARQIVRCNTVLTVFGGVRGIMVV